MAAAPGAIAPDNPLSPAGIPLAPPSGAHLLGTDEVGRDILSRVVYGAREDIVISLVSSLLAAIVGSAIGLVVGYIAGAMDPVVMRLVDVMLAFPTIILALFLITIVGTGERVEIIAISVVMFPSMVRFSRGLGVELRVRAFIDASRVSGLTVRQIVWRHIVPNAFAPLAVATSVLASSAILLGASLSFLGAGIQPPTPSWGGMLQSAFNVVYQSPLYGVAPGVCIVVVAGAYTLIGLSLRSWTAEEGAMRHVDAAGATGVEVR